MFLKKKNIALLFVLIVTLTACSNSEINKVNEAFTNVTNSMSYGYESTIKVDENASYYYSEDGFGNSHMIDTLNDNSIELYYIDDVYYVCEEECLNLNQDNLTSLYGEEYSISDMQSLIDDAADYHISQYDKLEQILSSDNLSDTLYSDDEGVITFIINGEDLSKEVFVIDESSINFSLKSDVSSTAELLINSELEITLP